ncbi:PIN domain-containing protein [Kitasatospora sp. NPDC058162]|uniref:PIN domain-containing protein n=1 Tax=Kitasatospora sp. NPDC058162 TaxID=3346362 RepID=UPI0036D8AD5B
MTDSSDFLGTFNGYWRRPQSDYNEAIRSYQIVLDTNVLLQLYRFTPQARTELLDVLKAAQDRLWVPHQVASEFYSRRIDALREHLDLYSNIPRNLISLKAKALEEIHAFAKRSSITPKEKERLIQPLESSFSTILEHLENYRNSFDLSLEIVTRQDPILEDLSHIFQGRTGEAFTESEIAEHIKRFSERAASKIPPGYKDAAKSDNAHGDYFLWEQTLRMAESTGRPILFVTNDEKEDWVRKEAGFTIGARPELIAEIKSRASVDFLIVNLGLFLRHAKDSLGTAVSDTTVAQAQISATSPEHLIDIASDRYYNLVYSLKEEANRLSDMHRAATELASDAYHIEDTQATVEAEDRAAEILDEIRAVHLLIEKVQRHTKRPSRGRVQIDFLPFPAEEINRISQFLTGSGHTVGEISARTKLDHPLSAPYSKIIESIGEPPIDLSFDGKRLRLLFTKLPEIGAQTRTLASEAGFDLHIRDSNGGRATVLGSHGHTPRPRHPRADGAV